MVGYKLKMITLFGVGYAAARQKRTLYEGNSAAFFLKHAEIYVVNKGAFGIIAVALKNFLYFAWVIHHENELALVFCGRKHIKAKPKGFFPELGQMLGKLLAACYYFNFCLEVNWL